LVFTTILPEESRAGQLRQFFYSALADWVYPVSPINHATFEHTFVEAWQVLAYLQYVLIGLDRPGGAAAHFYG
jgi:hypothetical protein